MGYMKSCRGAAVSLSVGVMPGETLLRVSDYSFTKINNKIGRIAQIDEKNITPCQIFLHAGVLTDMPFSFRQMICVCKSELWKARRVPETPLRN